jgi:hypothetical protein
MEGIMLGVVIVYVALGVLNILGHAGIRHLAKKAKESQP